MSKVIKAKHLLLVGDLDVKAASTRSHAVATAAASTVQCQAADQVKSAAADLLSCAHEECEALIASARAEAGALLAAAEAESETLRISACEQGFEQGFTAGMAEGAAAGSKLTAEAADLLAAVEAERDRVFTECREELARIALDIAGRLVDRELSVEPEIVGDLAAKALALVRESDRCVIRVNPRDVMIIEERKRALRKSAIGIRTIEVTGDESLDPGEIVVDCDRGQVDGRLSTRMATAEETVMEVVHDDES